jgi:acetyl/propionyl-CoA carboxylase alpha subunit
VRDDNGYYGGAEVSLHYDPMISKFIVHARDREQAFARMLRCLDEYVVHGVETNLEFLKSCLVYPDVVDRTLQWHRPESDA